MNTLSLNSYNQAPSLMVTLTTITDDSLIQAMYSYSASVIRLFNKQVLEFERPVLSINQNKKAPVFHHPNCTFPEYMQQRLNVSVAQGQQITWPDLTVRFTVTRSGKINNIKSSGATKEMREEAERIIRNSESMWVPAMQNESTVDYDVTQKVFFRFEMNTAA
jgi:Gram-negative bacterial TonB protein C-terminal